MKLHRQETQWTIDAQHLHIRGRLIIPHQRVALIVLFRPQLGDEPLDMSVERFLASLGFKQRGKLNPLGIESGLYGKRDPPLWGRYRSTYIKALVPLQH
jgi:hypothetical protein